MRLTITKLGLIPLLIVLLPIVLVIKLFRRVSGRRGPVLDQSAETYAGDPRAYPGTKRLVVIAGSIGAPVTKIALGELARIDRDIYDVAILDAATDRDLIRALDMTFLPTVCVFAQGKEIVRVQNLMRLEQIAPPPHSAGG